MEFGLPYLFFLSLLYLSLPGRFRSFCSLLFNDALSRLFVKLREYFVRRIKLGTLGRTCRVRTNFGKFDWRGVEG